jgi:hypothetical protein
MPFSTLINDGDTNAWVDECEELIRNGAKRRIALEILQADDLAARFATLEREIYDRLRRENRLRQPQQQLRLLLVDQELLLQLQELD